MRRHPWDPTPSDRHVDPSAQRGWRRIGRADPLLWLGIGGLAALGIANLVGLGDPGEAAHQLLMVLVGVGVAAALTRLRMRVWVVLGRLVYAGAVLLLGAVVLSELLKQFGRVDFAVAAYNAGPAAVDAVNGVPDIQETRDYVDAILKKIK